MKINLSIYKRMRKAKQTSYAEITMLMLGTYHFFNLAKCQYFKFDFLSFERNILFKTVLVTMVQNLIKFLTHQQSKICKLIWIELFINLNVNRNFNNHITWLFSRFDLEGLIRSRKTLLYEEKETYLGKGKLI